MNVRHFFLLVLISISFSCSKEKVILEKEVDVEESIGWMFSDSLSVDFSISDTNRLYAMRLQLNHTPDFNFEKLERVVSDSRSQQKLDPINFFIQSHQQIFDSDVNWEWKNLIQIISYTFLLFLVLAFRSSYL